MIRFLPDHRKDQRKLVFCLFTEGKQHSTKCRDCFRDTLLYRPLRTAAEGFPVGVQEHRKVVFRFRCNDGIPVREVEHYQNRLRSVRSGITSRQIRRRSRAST